MSLKASPKTARERRRAKREAQRRRQRLILIIIAVAILVVIAYIVYNNFFQNEPTVSDTSAVADPNIELVTTDSGLQYQDLVVGGGPAAQEGDMVVVHYTGWLTDGTKFDSSLDRGEPFTFTLGAGGVIKGWEEGIAGMQAGGQRKLIIPSELAYGASGRGAIPPNATLVFDVELLEIQSQ